MYLFSRNLILVISLNWISIHSSPSSLKLVQVIFRDGLSTPENSYPTDPYQNDSSGSPQGRGQLTQEGMEIQYNFGRSMSTKYKNEIENAKLERGRIVAVSSESERSIGSANAFLSGLLGLNYSQINELKILKILPCQQDNILHFCQYCSKYEQLSRQVLFWNSVRNTFEENLPIFKYMSIHSGLKIETISDFLELYSTLYDQKYSNKSIPDWADALFKSGSLERILSLMLRIPTSTKQLKRFRGGPLLKILMTNMSSIVNEQSWKASSPKLQVFSGYAETLISLLDCLDLFDGHFPSHSASVILELHQGPDSFHIEIYSNMESGKLGELKKLWIPACGFDCPWSSLHRILNPYLIGDFEVECETGSFPWNALLSAFILLAAFPVLLIFFVKLLEKRRTEAEFSPLLSSHKIF